MVIAPRALLIGLAASLLFMSVLSADASAYSTVRSARCFAIGEVGYAGVTTREELAMKAIRDSPRAQEELRKLLKDGTPAGQMYALFALRQRDGPDFAVLARPYGRSTTCVERMSGCIGFAESMSDTVRWIDQWAKKLKSWEKKT